MIDEPEWCWTCRHFRGVEQPDGTEMSETVVCEAYPRGIPIRIAYGTERHAEVQEDQVGQLVYNPA